MATAAAAPAAPPPASPLAATVKSVAQAVAIWGFVSYALPKLMGRGVAPIVTVPAPATTGLAGIPVPTTFAPLQRVNLFPAGALLDVLVQLSTADEASFGAGVLPAVSWPGIDYSDSSWTREWETDFAVPASVQHNGSLYVDVYVTPAGVSPDPATPDHDASQVLLVRKPIARFLPKRKVREVKNLLASKKDEDVLAVPVEEVVKAQAQPIVSYYHPNLTLEMVYSAGPIAYAQLPPNLQARMQIIDDETKLSSEGHGFHYPILFANDFWILTESMIELNTTTTKLPLKVSLSPVSFFKFQIVQTMDEAFSAQAASGGMGSAELDVLKQTLIETSPWLLATTFLVTILHMLFGFLAFASDIGDWRAKKELIGVSVRTIIANVVVQVIILLYLLDQNENTSWMILGGQGMGIALELWKVTKAVDIKLVPAPTSIIPYSLRITDKHVLSTEEEESKQYDKLAFQYVVYGCSPFVIGYTVYAAIYLEHRSLYSFAVQTATSMVYLGGFIQIIPVLIINYKLKSTAHLPRKTLIYKFLNTIVDDFAAVIIKQPFLHRLAAFRDDAVFVVLLYQMYIYRVDHSRANEFGQQLSKAEIAQLEATTKGKSVEVTESKKDI